MPRLLGLLVAVFLGAAQAQMNTPVQLEKVSIPIRDSSGKLLSIAGQLRMPDYDRRAGVLILHSTPGFDGRGAFYSEGLNQAGIATLEIDYLEGKGMPA